MSDWMLLWLFTRLNALSMLGVFMAVFGGLVAGFLCSYGYAEREPDSLRMGKRLCIIPILGIMLACLTPTKADMAIIVGGKIALDASRTDTAKEIGGEVLDAIRAQLKKAAQ